MEAGQAYGVVLGAITGIVQSAESSRRHAAMSSAFCLLPQSSQRVPAWLCGWSQGGCRLVRHLARQTDQPRLSPGSRRWCCSFSKSNSTHCSSKDFLASRPLILSRWRGRGEAGSSRAAATHRPRTRSERSERSLRVRGLCTLYSVHGL